MSKTKNYIPPNDVLQDNTKIITKNFKQYIPYNIEIEIERVGNNIKSLCYTYKISVTYTDDCDSKDEFICKVIKNNYLYIKDISIQASELNISPKVLYTNDDDNFIIFEYISIKSTKGVSHSTRISELIKNIKLYHSIKPNFTNEFKNNILLFDDRDILSLEPYKLAYSVYEKLYSYLSKHYHTVLTHHDLHDLNRLWEGKTFKIIDFEYSGINVPFIDICFQTIYFKNKEYEIIKEYFNTEPTQSLLNDFYIGSQASFLLYAMIFKYNFCNLENTTLSYSDIPKFSQLTYDTLYNLNFYNDNDSYLVYNSFIKESFTNILLKQNLFNNILSSNDLDSIQKFL
jgi:hypothetical protein